MNIYILRPPVILWLDERHGCYHGLPQLISHLHFQLSTFLVESVLYVTHGDILA